VLNSARKIISVYTYRQCVLEPINCISWISQTNSFTICLDDSTFYWTETVSQSIIMLLKKLHSQFLGSIVVLIFHLCLHFPPHCYFLSTLMKNLSVGVLSWKLITKHFSTHPCFSLHNRINSSEQPTGSGSQAWRLVGLNNSSQSKISRLQCHIESWHLQDLARTKKWLQDTKSGIWNTRNLCRTS